MRKGTDPVVVRESLEFDYIVVGSGAGGSVVANRLSADPNTSVLLLEAGGPDTDPAFHQVEVPALFGLWWGAGQADRDWGFATEVEAGLNGRKMPILQGKVEGGSTSTHGRIFIRGNRRDFDHWNYLGNEGWSFSDVLPYFIKLEDYHGNVSELRGVGGPLTVIDLPKDRRTPAAEAFVDGAVELGFQGDWDFNGPQQEGGAGFTQSTTTDSLQRASAAVAYIQPILARSNFTLQTGAAATRILLEGNRAVGVEYLQGGRLRQARASAEVVISAGALNTPKLLLLSGIGPAKQLQAHDIAVTADLPGVGENFHDHLLARVCYATTTEQPVPIIISESSLFTSTRAGMGAASPDLQFFFGGFLFPDVPHSGPGFTLVPVVAQPRSVGSVRLRSKDPTEPPVINANYLASDTDRKVLLEGIDLGRELIHTHAFDGLRGAEIIPGTDVTTERDLSEYIRNTCITDWHPSCTCKMGRDPMAVVDPQLRVHGVDGLRIADGSIMPSIVSGNLQATIYMIGEKGADMILQGS